MWPLQTGVIGACTKRSKEPDPEDDKTTNEAQPSGVFPKFDNEFSKADPLKRKLPEPNEPGERLQDYLG